MSREYYSKEDIIEIYLQETEKYELALFCIKPNQPHLFEATFLGYNFDTQELEYQVQGNPRKWVNLNDIIQIGEEYNYSSF